MQLYLDTGNADSKFATQLLNVGNGLLDQDSHNQIQLPFQIIQTDELRLPESFQIFTSNTLMRSSRDQIINYPIEFLNSLEATETSSHKLLLSLGSQSCCFIASIHQNYVMVQDSP